MGTLNLIVAAAPRFLGQDLAAVHLMVVTSGGVSRATAVANAYPPESPAPSLEVVNVAGAQLLGVPASNRLRTSDAFTPRAPSSTAAGSGGWRVRIWASTSGPVTWSFR